MNSCDCNDSLCDEIEKFLVDEDEGISKVAHEIHLMLLNIDLRENWVMNTTNINHRKFMKLRKKILESLNKYQHKTMILKVFLVKLKHKDEVLQDQLEDKKDEVEILKIELTSQVEEQKDPGEDS